MSSPSDSFDEDYSTHFLLPQGVGDTEDVERYKPWGFHPVHLGDKYDDGRYRIVHKLGSGGISTVWLAGDESESQWVALKIVNAEHSESAGEKSVLSHSATSNLRTHGIQSVVGHHRQFTLDGPNGRHLCLVLPVLGPSMSELSYGLTCRLTPWLARRVAYQATRAVADLHSEGLCHGDVTTGNILLGLLDINRFGEGDIYRLFGRPTTGELETESGEATGPEAPQYIVKQIDFLSSSSNIVRPDIKFVDFDQCFPISSPPEKPLGTPLDFLAPEVAVGLTAGPASDVWALGCCLFRLRSGDGPFSSPFDVTSPAGLMSYITHTLGEDMPPGWKDTTLWDSQGQPTKDPSKGKPHEQWWGGEKRSLQNMVYNIWDEPEDRIVQTGTSRSGPKFCRERDHQPFPSCFSDMVWNPRAVKIDNIYLSGYDDKWGELLEVLPKIAEHEAALLYDLLSKIFVYDPARRPTAREMLSHAWFHLPR